jgi:metallo-beta-lactamase family protein
MQSITFLGAARTVTGSKHLIETGGKRILVDCGLFQGGRELRERNWAPFAVPPESIDAVVITHAHMDHIGYLPRLVSHGYQGPIYATPATIDLARISLPDSARIQEEDARHANRHGFSRHKPALPLYDEKQAYASLKQLEPVDFGHMHQLPGGAQWRYLMAGHILGSAFAEIYFENGERILMSGDLGRYDAPIIKDPTTIDFAEYLVVESTYGDRLHEREDPMDHLERILGEVSEQGLTLLVPSFSIGRTQELLYFIRKLELEQRVKRIPIYVDSPMATSVTGVTMKYPKEHDEDMLAAGPEALEPELLKFIRDREESKALNSQRGPMIIIAGSGMANGGRIVHHLAQRLPEPDTFVLFTGYQAEGTLGRTILEKPSEVMIHGHPVQVRAQIDKLNSLSAHADQGEIMRWLGGFKTPPRTTFIVHGEPHAQDVLRAKIESELGWHCEVPEQGQRFDLSAR